MNLQRPKPEIDEEGNPIHKTDGEALAFFRDYTPDNEPVREILIETYWGLRAKGYDINESRTLAVKTVFTAARMMGWI